MDNHQLTGAYYQNVGGYEQHEGKIPPQVVEYRGHQANSGGLQGHSLGDEYPYLVYLMGTDNGEFWKVLDTRTSVDVYSAYQQQDAINHVRKLKAGLQ